jgi:hypothetical protein
MYRAFLFHLRFLVGAMLLSHLKLFLKSVYRDEVPMVVTLAEFMWHVWFGYINHRNIYNSVVREGVEIR